MSSIDSEKCNERYVDRTGLGNLPIYGLILVIDIKSTIVHKGKIFKNNYSKKSVNINAYFVMFITQDTVFSRLMLERDKCCICGY